MNSPGTAFNNAYDGITAAGSTFPASFQVQNTFFGSDVAMDIQGYNYFLLNNNNIDECVKGILLDNTGSSNNKVSCNEFIETPAISIKGKNSRTEFLGNDFSNNSNQSYDVQLSEDYKVRPIIGNLNNPAGNCFSNIASDIVPDGSGTSFNYVFSSVGDNCQVPSINLNFQQIPVTEQDRQCLNGIGPFNIIDPTGGNDKDYYLAPPFHPDSVICWICIQDSINFWIDNVLISGGDDPRTETDESQSTPTKQMLQSEETLDQWINYGIYLALETGQYNQAQTILSPLLKWEWQAGLFGVHMLARDYNSAQATLNTLPVNNTNQIYFRDIQQINLQVQSDPGNGNFTLTDSDLNYIKTIAESNFPVKGYAISLYKYITGINLLQEFNKVIKQRSSILPESKIVSTDLQIYPNPTDNIVNVNSTSDIKELKVYDMEGRLMSTSQARKSVDVSSLNSGAYFLHIHFEDGREEVKKIAKQ